MRNCCISPKAIASLVEYCVFELHRLIKVQRLIAGSPHVLLEDNLLLNKPPPKTSTTKKFQSDFASQKPSSVVKLDNKSVKVNTAEKTQTAQLGRFPFLVSVTQPKLPNYGHHLGNPALASADSNSNSKQSPSYVYPPPGNQWLVPVMSPFEGLVYKPIIWPCPPNAGFMAPINALQKETLPSDLLVVLLTSLKLFWQTTPQIASTITKHVFMEYQTIQINMQQTMPIQFDVSYFTTIQSLLEHSTIQ
ncbi:ELF3-like protein 2 [Glycine soja]